MGTVQGWARFQISQPWGTVPVGGCYITPYYEAVCNNHNVPLGTNRKIDFCPSDDYHVYGLLWTKRELVWYVDNVEMARMNISAYGHGGFPRPLHVVFDCEYAECKRCALQDARPEDPACRTENRLVPSLDRGEVVSGNRRV